MNSFNGYIHPTLKKEVPTEYRLKIYELAIEYYENYEEISAENDRGEGLCLVLPCILWNLPTYHNSPPHQEFWDWGDSVVAFPELQKVIYYFKSYKKRMKNPVPIRFRVNALKIMIKEVKSKN